MIPVGTPVVLNQAAYSGRHRSMLPGVVVAPGNYYDATRGTWSFVQFPDFPRMAGYWDTDLLVQDDDNVAVE